MNSEREAFERLNKIADKEIPTADPYAGEHLKVEAVVNCDRLNVRALPQPAAEILGVVTRGTRLEVLDQTQEWYQVKSVYGDGYVMKKFTEVI